VRRIPASLLIGNPTIFRCPACGKGAFVFDNGCLQCAECEDGKEAFFAPDPEDSLLWEMLTAFARRAGIFPDRFSKLRAEMLSLPVVRAKAECPS
jgi:hypothetical protein